MRLAIFTNVFPANVSTFLARDIRALLAAGVEVDVFSFYRLDPRMWQYVPEILPESLFPHERVHHVGFVRSLLSLRPWPLRAAKIFLGEAAAVSVSALRFGAVPLMKSLYVLPKAWIWARRPPRDYDHVLAYWGNYSATCARVFHRLLGRDIPFSMFLHAGMDLYRRQVYLRQKLLEADNIFVVCEFNREFLRRHFADVFPRIAPKIHLHHLGLDVENFPFRQEGRAPRRILGVGRLVEGKGFDDVLRTAHELLRRGRDVEVELAGDGAARGALERLTDELGIHARVRFPGYLAPAAVRQAMGEATVLVHAPPAIGDAVPTVIKEAQATGLPVVGTQIAGIPELLDHGRAGILVPPKDIAALAGAVERLLTDEFLWRQYSFAGRQFAERTYDMWANGKRLAGILESTGLGGTNAIC